MADIKDLRVRVTADTKGLQQISSESKKVASDIERSTRSGRSTFSQFNQELDRSALKIGVIGGLVGGLAAQFAVAAAQALRTIASLPVRLFDALLTAGRSAEQQILRIGTVLRIPEEAARQAFTAIREFAAPLPATTDEIVNAFIALEAINLSATEENLTRVTNAALATGQSVQDITTVLASTEVEPLRRLGIELDRTGKKAVIAFKDIRIETDKSAAGVREGLLELFAEAFPDGIERSRSTFNTALDEMRSLISDLLVGEGSNLSAFLAGLVRETNEWIKANGELIEQNLADFVDTTKTAIIELTEAIKGLISEYRLWRDAIDEARDRLHPLRAAIEGVGTGAEQASGPLGGFVNLLKEAAKLQFKFFNPFAAQDAIFGQIRGGAEGLAEARRETEALVGAIDNADATFNAAFGTVEAGKKTLDDFAGKGGGGGLGGAADEAGKAQNKIESLNNSMEKQIETLRQSIAAIDQNKFAVIEMAKAAFLAKGGSQELANEFERLSKQQLNTNQIQELRDRLEDINREIAIFGQSPEFIAQYDAAVLKAKLTTDGFGDEITAEVDKILDAEQKLSQLEFGKNLEEQFASLGIVENQIRDVREELANLVNTVLQIAASPELSEKFGINFARAQEIIVQATAQAQKDIRNIELQAYADRLQLSDSFWDQMKGGIIEFALSVESNGELAAQFFADTLSQMSQNFSDFFYNVLTGKFEDLVDVAKNAFQAILRAFLDMVAAIATRQIVISIGGIFGLGKSSRSAGGGSGNPLDLAQQGIGVAGSSAGLFGAGGAFSTFGAGITGGLAAVPGASAAGATASSLTAGAVASTPTAVVPGFLATAGAAITIVGAALAVAGLAYTIIAPFLKKTPRYAFKFESVETEVGERAAQVKEFLDADFFSEEIFKKIVGRGGGGAFSGKEVDELKKAIQEAIAGTVKEIQAIINKLPQDMAEFLNEALLDTAVDTETKIGRSNLLGFDAKGKKNIKEKLEKFFQGDLQGRFIFAVRDFFQIAFEQLGILPEKASAFIDAEFERFKNAKSPEERAQIGQEFLASFNAFVDAFNIVSGNVNDAIGQTIQNINALSNDLGFKAVPSIGELREELGKLLENAELDPQTVQAYADLRNAIVSLTSEVVNSITGLIGKMQSLNQTMASLGLATVDLGGYLSQAASQIQNFLQNQGSELSLGEQEAFLDQLAGIANAMLQEEQAAFNATQERLRAEAQRTFEAQRAVIQGRIEGLNQEKEAINEVFRSRIDALNEELRLAQDFAAATESIRNTLDGIIFSQQSIFTAVERVNMLQGNIADLQNQLAGADDPARQLDLIKSLESAFATLFDTAGEAFGVNSPEFVSIFDQVTGGLADLANMTENRGRSVEEIQAEIERLTAENGQRISAIDASIKAAQAQLANLQQQTVDNTFVASRELQDLFAYIQSEYQRLLDERFKQLEEVNQFGFKSELEGLSAIAELAQESLVTLKGVLDSGKYQTGYLAQIASVLTNGGSTAAGVPGFAHGSGGLMDFGRQTLAFLHGREAVFTEPQLANLTRKLTSAGYISSIQNQLPRTPEQVLRERTADIAGDSKKTIEVIIHSDNPAVVQTVTAGLAKELAKEMAKEIDPTAVTLKGAVQNASRKAPR